MMNASHASQSIVGLVSLVAALTGTLLTAQAPKPQFPTGTFVAESLSMTFANDGTHTVTDRGTVVVRGTYVVKGDQITLTDKDGDFACDVTGRYQWAFDGRALTFKLILDDCSGRVDGLTGQRWVKQ